MTRVRPPGTEALTPTAAEPLPLELRVVQGPDAGKALPLEVGTVRVGSDSACELTLTDRSVSRLHLLVEVLPSGARLSDAGSTNGSFCNGLRFSSVEVGPGALVRLGRTVLKLDARTRRPSQAAPQHEVRLGKLVGRSARMKEVLAQLERAAKAGSDVLVEGETGTGKELCARALHELGPASKGPFVVCDLSALTADLLASSLFGHRRGAFTGAGEDRPGLVEQADGGTLFLDEVGELPLESQPLLLRLLEGREVRRLGETAFRKVSLRVVAATHVDLEARIAEGRFRRDLFHRLGAIRIRLPPLRERPEDISLLADQLLRELGHDPADLGPEARAMLVDFPWLGNIRELKNVIQRVVTLQEPLEPPEAASRRVGTRPLEESAEGPFHEAKERLVAAFERDYLTRLLERCAWNVRRAARESGLDRVHLYRLLKKHGLAAKDSR